MALFGLFKSKKDREFEQSMEQFQHLIYPRGEKDIERDCARIDALTNGKIHHSILRGFVSGCKTIAYINESYDDEGFANSNIARSDGLITKDEALDVYAYLEGESKYYDTMNRMFGDMGVDSDDGDDSDEIFGNMPWIFSEGVSTAEIPGGYGDYGLCKTNPILTISVNCTNKYLAKLRYKGNSIVANRLGSTSSEVTPGSIDIYELSVSGRDIGTIYICPYHKRNSKKPPYGFTLTV
jgi:hypothetical protein